MWTELFALISFLIALVIFLQPTYLPRLIDFLLGHTPPGPFSWPVVGARNIDSDKPWKTFTQWGERYGGAVSFFLGTEFVVVLTDIKAIRAALHSPSFDGRPLTPIGRTLNKHLGIGLTDGPAWPPQRKFAAATLRSAIGSGHPSTAYGKYSQIAVQDFLEAFAKTADQPFFVRPLIERAIVTSLSSIVHEGQLTPDDPHFPRLMEAYQSFFSASLTTNLLNIMPWLKYVPPHREKYSLLKAAVYDMAQFARDAIAEKRKVELSEAVDGTAVDFVDAFRRELENADRHPSFTEEQLTITAAELLMAGSEDSTNVLLWTVLFTALYPDDQRRIQDLLDRVVGRNRGVSLTDRKALGLVDAFIAETIRFSNAVPHPLPRRAMEDTVCLGFKIPAGTVLITNTYSVHFSEELWDEPFMFRPERFLDKEGNFCPNQNILAFGMGRRICIGEQFAKMEMFMLLASVLQRFQISLPEGMERPDPGKTSDGINLTPKPFQIQCSPR